MTSQIPSNAPLTPSGSDAPRGIADPNGAQSRYAPPRLRVYGDLAQITAKVGSTGRTDHGSGSKNRTGF